MATPDGIFTARRQPGEGRRGRLAALAAAVLVAALIAPVPAGADHDFTDVGGTVHEEAIGALADLGVLDRTECGENLFCPDEPIERWVMAVWLIRVLGGDMTPDGTSRFADVDAAEWWSPFAEQLAIREITAGCDLPGEGLRPAGRRSGRVHRHRRQRPRRQDRCKTGPLRYCPRATAGVTIYGMQDGSAPLLPRRSRHPRPDCDLPVQGTGEAEGRSDHT